MLPRTTQAYIFVSALVSICSTFSVPSFFSFSSSSSSDSTYSLLSTISSKFQFQLIEKPLCIKLATILPIFLDPYIFIGPLSSNSTVLVSRLSMKLMKPTSFGHFYLRYLTYSLSSVLISSSFTYAYTMKSKCVNLNYFLGPSNSLLSK